MGKEIKAFFSIEFGQAAFLVAVAHREVCRFPLFQRRPSCRQQEEADDEQAITWLDFCRMPDDGVVRFEFRKG
ncbi:MAG: hypothetical protein MI741_23490, partial [Rhodospirillales bacterium]|nr:hypothetical protein [Rhodospirillales bacterium]